MNRWLGPRCEHTARGFPTQCHAALSCPRRRHGCCAQRKLQRTCSSPARSCHDCTSSPGALPACSCSLSLLSLSAGRSALPASATTACAAAASSSAASFSLASAAELQQSTYCRMGPGHIEWEFAARCGSHRTSKRQLAAYSRAGRCTTAGQRCSTCPAKDELPSKDERVM